MYICIYVHIYDWPPAVDSPPHTMVWSLLGWSCQHFLWSLAGCCKLVSPVPVVRDWPVSYEPELNILSKTQSIAYAQGRTNRNPTRDVCAWQTPLHNLRGERGTHTQFEIHWLGGRPELTGETAPSGGQGSEYTLRHLKKREVKLGVRPRGWVLPAELRSRKIARRVAPRRATAASLVTACAAP